MRAAAAPLGFLAALLAIAGAADAQDAVTDAADYTAQVVAYALDYADRQPLTQETQRAAEAAVAHAQERADPAWLVPWAEATTAPAGAAVPFAQAAAANGERAVSTAADAVVEMTSDAGRPANGAAALGGQIVTTMLVAANAIIAMELEGGYPSPAPVQDAVENTLLAKERTERMLFHLVAGETTACHAAWSEASLLWYVTDTTVVSSASFVEAALARPLLPPEAWEAYRSGTWYVAEPLAFVDC